MPLLQEAEPHDRVRKHLRLNLNSDAWRRLRVNYSDQPISIVADLQSRIAGFWLAALQRVAYGPQMTHAESLEIIFIIGHWRSGTTLLHELLCSDPRFNYTTTYACMNPQVFPITETAVLQRAGSRSIMRPMDRMSISLASPQEDEFALLALGAASPYEGLLFPKALDRAMATADPDDLDEPQQHDWVGVFLRFLGQVAARKPGYPMVLKSPTHSYRIKILSRLFPNAKFVHLIRNPLNVYSSTISMWKKLCSLYALTGMPEDNAIATQVIRNWIRMEEKLDAAIPSLGKSNYARVHYEALTASPVAEMQRIYSELALGGFEQAVPHIESHLAGHAQFEKNRFDLAAREASNVHRAWHHIFEKYGYAAPT